MTDSLSARELCLIRGERCLFEGISFALNSGELLLVEGANGSGKTSLLRSIAGLLELESGEIEWNGQAVSRNQQQFRAAFAWFAHRTGFKGDLTAEQNLQFEAGLRCFLDGEFHTTLERVGVVAGSGLPIRAFSAGQQRRVGLARMILSEAPLWMMDEPFTNLDSEGQDLVRALVDDHLASGGLCVMASHQGIDVDARVQRISL